MNEHPHNSEWPALPLEAWKDTCATLHMWLRIVGKVRMELSPPLNHWWGTTLYVNSRGLTTSAIPWEGGVFEIQFDFIRHQLLIHTSQGTETKLGLHPAGFGSQAPQGSPGFYHPQMKEFVLRYENVRQASSPRDILLKFLRGTYEAGANPGGWARTDLEKPQHFASERSA